MDCYLWFPSMFCSDQEDGLVEVAPLCKNVGMG